MLIPRKDNTWPIVNNVEASVELQCKFIAFDLRTHDENIVDINRKEDISFA